MTRTSILPRWFRFTWLERLPYASWLTTRRRPASAHPLTVSRLRPEIEPYEDRRHMEPDFGGLAQIALLGAGAALLGDAISRAASPSVLGTAVTPSTGATPAPTAATWTLEGALLPVDLLPTRGSAGDRATSVEPLPEPYLLSPGGENSSEGEEPWDDHADEELASGTRRYGTPPLPDGTDANVPGNAGGVTDGGATGGLSGGASLTPEPFVFSREGDFDPALLTSPRANVAQGVSPFVAAPTDLSEVTDRLSDPPREPHASEVVKSFALLPVAFEPNLGQTDSQVRFLSHGPGYRFFLTDNAAILDFARPESASDGIATSRDALRLSFVGGSATRFWDQEELPGRSNYFGAAHGAVGLTNVPQYAQVVAKDLYPGIDLVFHSTNDRQLEYDFRIAPGADPDLIRLRLEGATTLTLDAEGSLLIGTAGGRLVQRNALLFQEEADGQRRFLGGRTVLRDDGEIGFTVDAYDPTRPLVIDPVFVYSSYLGGSGDDKAYAVAADTADNAYVMGTTTSNNFPTSVGAYDTTNDGNAAAFLSKFSADGSTLVYSSYLAGGGSGGFGTGSATIYGVSVDLANNAYVTGTASSSDFPTTPNAYQPSSGGDTGFVTKLNATGDALLYSTYLGITGTVARAIAVNPYGQATVTGATPDDPFTDYPTTSGAFQTSYGGGSTDAFVTRMNADGTDLIYSSFLGGSGDESGYGLALDADGNAYIGGLTTSSNFPTTSGAYDTTHGGGTNDAFLTKVNDAGTSKTYSTYLGGNGDDKAYSVTVNIDGNAFIAGSTSGSFPTTTGAYQTSHGGGTDLFATKFNSGGTALTWSTYAGGSGDDIAYGIGVDLSGYPAVVGSTTGSFPTTSGAMQTTYGGGSTDGFVLRLETDATALAYSSYLGGSGTDETRAVALDPLANAALAGFTNSTNFPTASPLYGSLTGSGTYDAFLTKVSPKPLPPVFTSISTDSGSSSTDEITTDSTLTLSGTGTANGTVTLYRAGVGQIGTASINSSGVWTYDYTGTTLAEGTHAFWGTVTSGGYTGEPSREFLVTVDASAPAVNITVASSTTSLAPTVRVTASDLNGLTDGTQVSLDADLNNDGDFLDTSESSYATSTLTGGSVLIVPTAFSTTGTYRFRARVTDKAGNEGTSSTSTVTVTSVTSWSATGQVLSVDPQSGMALEQLGNLRLVHPLDLDKSPGTHQGGNPALVYNSSTVSVTPIVQATIQSANNASLPSTVTATLTFNGTAGSATNYSTSGLAAGDSLVIAAQATNAITTTARYAWSLTIQISGQSNINLSGTTYVVAQDSSVFGAGWTFSGTDRLVDIAADANGPAGKLRVYGSGGWRFYEGTSTFTSPAEDNGTLASVSGTFEYATPDGQKWIFNSSGYQTGWKSADAQELLTYTYDGSNNLTGLTAIDGALATFTYSAGKVESLAAVNNRTTTLTHSSGDLTKITNTDEGKRTFTYDANHRATREQYGPNVENNWAYSASGTLATITWGKSDSPSVSGLSSANGQGLSAARRAPAVATIPDAYNYPKSWELDNRARPTQHVAADGGVTRWTRDSAGRVTAATDPLNRATTITRDSAGFVTQETLPDGTTRNYAYQTSFHALTTFTNERSDPTTYAYDASGHMTSTTDALGGRTTLTHLTNGLPESVRDARGNLTTYVFDSNRRLTTTTNALGDLATLTYDASGNVQTSKDQLGRVTTLAHDTMSRLTKLMDALGGVMTYNYDPVSLLTSQIDQLSRTAQTQFDIYKRGLPTGHQVAVGTSVQAGMLASHDAVGRVSGTRDPNGWWIQDAYDPVGRPRQTTDALGGVRLAAYDLDGQPTAQRDELGRWTRHAFNARGRETTRTDALGGLSTFAYDASGNLTVMTDPLNRSTTFQFDKLHRHTVTIDALAGQATFTYDPAGNVATVTDQLGRVASSAYDALNRRTTTTEAVGTSLQRTGTFSYDKVGNVTVQTDALGRSYTYAYDALDRRTEIVDPLGGRSTATFDAVGNPVTLKDQLGRTTTIVHDARHRPIETINALGQSTRWALDARGQPVGRIDAAGRVHQQGYDPLGQPVVALDALLGLAHRRFDTVGNGTSAVDAHGNETQYVYDDLNRWVQTRDALGGVTTMGYDAVGNRTVAIDARGQRVTVTHDALNRQTAITDPQSHTLTFVYDAVGNRTKTLDAEGKATTYTFDALNRREKVQDPGGGVFTMGYDAVDNVTHAIDAVGNRTTFTRDVLNRRTQTTDARGGVLTELYDAVSNRTGVIDPVGNRTTFVHDALNRVSEEIDSLNKSVTYAYDAVGRLSSRTDRLSRRRDLNYDAAGRLTGEIWKNADSTTAQLLTFTYDTEGYRLSAANGAGAYTMSYDALGRLTAVQEPYSQRLTYSYDAVGNRTRQEDSFGGVTTSTYDAANLLTKREFGGSSQTPLRIDLTYTARNQVETQTRYSDLAGTTKVGSTTYTYDAALRVSNLQHRDGSGSLLANYTYTYDLAHRLNTESLNGTTKTYTHDATDQLTNDGSTAYSYDLNGNRTMSGYQTGTGNRLTNDGTWTYTYDDEGNLTQRSKGAGLETWDFSWNHANRLTSVRQTSNGSTDVLRATYTYAVFGDRLQEEKWKSTTGTVTSRFAYDGREVWADLDGSNGLKVRYLRGDAVDELFARVVSTGQPNAGAAWYLVDRLGSVRDLVNASGVVQDHLDYAGFGVATESNASFGDRWKFTSREFDSDTGLQQNRARWYDARVGRWLSNDPLGFGAGDANRYRYVRNRPLRGADPSGLMEPPTGTGGPGDPVDSLGEDIDLSDPRHRQKPDKEARDRADREFNREYYRKQRREDLHTLLDLAGWVPGAGEFFDLINAGIYWSEGKHEEAALSGISVIPVVGDVIGKGGKIGRPFIKGLLGGAEHAGDIAKVGDDIVEAGGNLVKKGGGRADEIGQGIGKGGDNVADAAQDGGRISIPVIGQRSCFVQGTPLLTPTGGKRIETFIPGDLILTRPENDPDGLPEARAVSEVFVRVSLTIELHVRGQVIRTTGEHPFYALGRGWVCARELHRGDQLNSHDGRWVMVEGIIDKREVATVYNLSVSDFHTYFVGSEEWQFSVWAHNADDRYIPTLMDDGKTWGIIDAETWDWVRYGQSGEGPIRKFEGLDEAENVIGQIRYQEEVSAGIPAETGKSGKPKIDLSGRTSDGAEHHSGARGSTKDDHQRGQTRKQDDYGGERGDERRGYPRRRPPGTEGKWPPEE